MTTGQPSRGSSDGHHPDIDAAARQLAFASGLSSITLRRLVSVSGLTPGLIAQHEPSMAALVARTFEELATTEIHQTEVELAARATAIDGLRTLVDSLLHASHDNFNSIWADAWSIGRRNAPVAKAARDTMVLWNALVHGLVAEGIAKGEFTDVDPDLVAMQFFALIDSTTAYSLVGYLTDDERTRVVLRTLEITLGLPEDALSQKSAMPGGHSPHLLAGTDEGSG
ncbi:MAG: hypothetical protein JWP75_3628 [Frondihabitans sp.]|nr:hypothetical protein [Frondihabitans sp.]